MSSSIASNVNPASTPDHDDATRRRDFLAHGSCEPARTWPTPAHTHSDKGVVCQPWVVGLVLTALAVGAHMGLQSMPMIPPGTPRTRGHGIMHVFSNPNSSGSNSITPRRTQTVTTHMHARLHLPLDKHAHMSTTRSNVRATAPIPVPASGSSYANDTHSSLPSPSPHNNVRGKKQQAPGHDRDAAAITHASKAAAGEHVRPSSPPQSHHAHGSQSCVIHDANIDPTTPTTLEMRDRPGIYTVLAVKPLKYQAALALRTYGIQGKKLLPCSDDGDELLFTATSGDGHSNPFKTVVSACKRPSQKPFDGHSHSETGTDSEPYFAAVCLPMLFGGVAREVLQLFVTWHLSRGFDRIFAYAYSAEDTFDMDGVTWYSMRDPFFPPNSAAMFCTQSNAELTTHV